MHLRETPIDGCFLAEIESHADDRGFFARTHCEEEFAAKGLIGRFQQSSVSVNTRRGTVRGMHFSVGPSEETKLVRCTSGAIHDVLVDLRRGSPTYMRRAAFDLSAQNRTALYVAAGIAHGFQTLQDASEVLYMIDKSYSADAARGVRWNDPALAITWPEPISIISQRDLAYPDWER